MAVHAELVDADRLVFERRIRTVAFGEQGLDLADGLAKLLTGHHGAGPPVAHPRGTLECDIGVTADVERYRLGRGRAHLQFVEIVEITVEFDHPAVQNELDDLDHLVDALAPARVRHPAPLEFLWCPADSHTEAEPVVGQVGHRADLACQQQRVAGAQFHHVGVEKQLRGHRAHRADGDQWIDPRRVLVPHPRPVGGVRVIGGGLLHVEQRVWQRDRVESHLFGGLCDVDQLIDRPHRDAAGVLHGLSAPTTHIE